MNFLNLPNWQITQIQEDHDAFFVRAIYIALRTNCINCFAGVMHLRKNGTRIRTFRDAPVFGKKVSGLLKIQGYSCNNCKASFFDDPAEIESHSRFTKRLVRYIEQAMVRRSAYSISDETGVSESTVRKIFTDFFARVEQRRSRILPEILGIDDVYISRVARCILTSGVKNQVYDILPKRDLPTVYGYLCSFESRKMVRLVTMDMYRPFYSTVRGLMPQAEIVIDTFHVRRMAGAAVMMFLTKLRNSLGYSQRRIQIRDRFLLLKRNYNLNEEEKRKLLNWRQALPLIGLVYDLKEDFLRLWQLTDRAKAEVFYKRWCARISPEIRFAFKDIMSTINNWYHEIFNYFHYRITNAFTESANRLIKDIQRQSCGISFETVRAKMICRYINRRHSLDNDSVVCDCVQGTADSNCYCGLRQSD